MKAKYYQKNQVKNTALLLLQFYSVNFAEILQEHIFFFASIMPENKDLKENCAS